MKLISNNDLTIDEKIKSFLFLHGITEEVNIPEIEKEMVLMLLSETDIDSVYVENGDLIIESSKEETDE
jgi:hypothetical protein